MTPKLKGWQKAYGKECASEAFGHVMSLHPIHDAQDYVREAEDDRLANVIRRGAREGREAARQDQRVVSEGDGDAAVLTRPETREARLTHARNDAAPASVRIRRSRE